MKTVRSQKVEPSGMILLTLQEESGKAPYFLSEFYDTVKFIIPREVVGGLSVAANNLDKV